MSCSRTKRSSTRQWTQQARDTIRLEDLDQQNPETRAPHVAPPVAPPRPWTARPVSIYQVLCWTGCTCLRCSPAPRTNHVARGDGRDGRPNAARSAVGAPRSGDTFVESLLTRYNGGRAHCVVAQLGRPPPSADAEVRQLPNLGRSAKDHSARFGNLVRQT